jgi:hypothetical protein
VSSVLICLTKATQVVVGAVVLVGLTGDAGCRCGRATKSISAPQAVKYLKGQLHLHSSRSGDSHTPPSDVLRWYQEHGYDFVVFTDHNFVGAPPSSTVLSIPGAELTQNLKTCDPAPEPNEYCVLHLNALFVSQVVGAAIPWTSGGEGGNRRALYENALATTLKLGGIAQLNHPNFHHAADAALVIPLARKGLSLLEIANQSKDTDNAGDERHPSTEAMWDQVLTAGAMVYAVASDDAHHYDDADGLVARGETVHTGDHGFVMVRAAKTPADIRQAVARGDFYSSTGVLLETASATRDEFEITVAPSAVGPHRFSFIGQGGHILARMEGRQARFTFAKAEAGYVRAVVEDQHGQKAWLQPVRVPTEARP